MTQSRQTAGVPRSAWIVVLIGLCGVFAWNRGSSVAYAQGPAATPGAAPAAPAGTRPPSARISRSTEAAPSAAPASNPGNVAPVSPAPSAGPAPGGASAAPAVAPGSASLVPGGTRVARVTKGAGVLPNDSGQVWREYDISPYTSRVKTTEKPEQAVIDWVLRETGTELWFSEPLGILSADKNTLRVYHTPEIQKMVAGVVDRFVGAGTETQVLALRLATVGSPNWRARAYTWLRPVEVKSPGIDAWLLSKENAAYLLADLAKRSDYREHNSPNLMISSGQSQTISRLRPRNYVKAVRPRDTVIAGYDTDLGQVDEGYSIQLSPLFALDGRSVDAVIKCHIDQVEKLVPVTIDIPGFGGQWQRAQVQVPQVVSWRLNERFRWATDQVLLLSCGVVATPAPDAKTGAAGLVGSLMGGTTRADALLFIECHGRTAAATPQDEPKASAANGQSYRGRY